MDGRMDVKPMIIRLYRKLRVASVGLGLDGDFLRGGGLVTGQVCFPQIVFFPLSFPSLSCFDDSVFKLHDNVNTHYSFLLRRSN